MCFATDVNIICIYSINFDLQKQLKINLPFLSVSTNKNKNRHFITC